MTVTFLTGTPAFSTGSVTTVSFNLPSGMQDGDYALVSVALNASAGTITTPDGWTDVLPSTNGTASTSLAHAIFYRKWSSGDPTSVAVAVKSGRVAAIPVRVRGADPGTFLSGAASVIQAGAGATTVTAPAVTPGAGDVAVHSWAARSPNNGVVLDWTPGPGVTEGGQAAAQATGQTNASAMIGSSSGGARTATASASTTGAMGASFVVKAAAVMEEPSGNLYADPGFTDPTRNAARSNRGWTVSAGQASWPGPAEGDFYLNDSNVWGESAGLTAGLEYEFTFTVAAAGADVWVNWYKSDPWVSLSEGQSVGTTPVTVTFTETWTGPQTFVGIWVAGPAVISNPSITAVTAAATLTTAPGQAAAAGGTATLNGTAPPALTEVTGPERGWYHYTETHETADGTGRVPLTVASLQAARALGRTVIFRYYVLDKYLGTDTIEQSFLDMIVADCDAARTAGVKLLARFTYSTAGGMTPPYYADPPAARVQAHIAQLAPRLAGDVTDAVQAGFIGMWGEWYYTDNFGDLGTVTPQQWADRKAVVDALLEHLDSRIFVLVRYVGAMRRLIDAEPANPDYAARLGHHNDAFMTDTHDWGTYETFSDGYTAAQNRAWLAARNTSGSFPMVGETAGYLPPRSDLPQSLVELEEYAWTSLNPSYHPDVLAAWGTAGRGQVGARLGYRLTLSAVTATVAGATVDVSFTVTNDGWAGPYRDRQVLVDFVAGGTVVTREITADVRAWKPGATNVSGTVAAPGAGEWTLFLRVADPSLPADPLQAIPFAGVFDQATGRNATGQTVTTTAQAATTLTTTAGAAAAGGTPVTLTGTPGGMSGTSTVVSGTTGRLTARLLLAGVSAVHSGTTGTPGGKPPAAHDWGPWPSGKRTRPGWAAQLMSTMTGDTTPPLTLLGGSWTDGPLNAATSGTVRVPVAELRRFPDWWWSKWSGSVVLSWAGKPVIAGPILADPSGWDTVDLRFGGLFSLLDCRYATDRDYGPGQHEALAHSELNYSGMNLGGIAADLTQRARSKPWGGFPFRVASPNEAGQVDRVRNYLGHNISNNSVAKLVQEITNVINGPDVVYRPEWTDGGVEWVMYHGTEGLPQISQDREHTIDLTAPRARLMEPVIHKETTQIFRAYVTGQGEGPGTEIAIKERDGQPAYLPALETVLSDSQATNAHGLLDERGAAAVTASETVQLSVSLPADDPAMPLTSWFTGDEFIVRVPDLLHIKKGTYRMRVVSRSGSGTSPIVKTELQPEELVQR